MEVCPMQANFFGNSRPMAVLTPPWMKATTMTATATIYTPFGFAVAADGNQRWENLATRDDFIRRSESDKVQKIFEFSSMNSTLGYFIRGHVANRDRSFAVDVELKNHLASLRSQSLDAFGLINTVSSHLDGYIKTAKNEKRIEEYPEIFIEFFGYVGGEPLWVELQFLHYPPGHRGLLCEIVPRNLRPGACLVSGSLLIRDLIFQKHPLFFPFCAPFDYTESLDQATGFVKGYIEACCSPDAPRFDPDCESLGGHIHVATVSPQGGFRWVVAPI